jgi:integrase
VLYARTRRKKGRNEKGLGTLTLRGRTFLFRVKINGKEHAETIQTDDLEKAKEERDRILRRLRAADALAPNQQNVTVPELLDDYIEHLKDEGCKDALGIEQTLKSKVQPWFVGRLAISVSTQDAKNYRLDRTTLGGVVDETVNKELKYLRAAFNFGRQQTPAKVSEVPYFPMVVRDNARQGFLEIYEYRRLLACLPDSLKPFSVLAYHSGCRKSELTNLKWSQVNRELRVIQLAPGTTKNDDGRNLPFYGDIEETLNKQQAIHRAECPSCEYVLFWHKTDSEGVAKRQAGSKLKGFVKSWNRARIKAGLPDVLAHDMRRSAVRNMVQYCGLSEARAMKISGHKTRAVFDRYNIVSLTDIQDAGSKLDAWMKAATARAEENERTQPIVITPDPMTMKQKVRQLYYVDEKSVEEIMTALNIAESTIYYHLSKDGWRKNAG